MTQNQTETPRVLRVVEGCLLALLAFGVCAFGAVQGYAYGTLELGVFLLLILALWTRIGGDLSRWRVVLWPLLFVLFCALALVPLPPRWLSYVSPVKLSVLSGISSELGSRGGLSTALSVSPYSTQVMLLKVALYIGAFWLAYLLFDYRSRKPILLGGLLVLGVFEGAYGLVQYLTGWQKIFWITKQFYTEEATGTYINRNHYAGFLEMLIPVMFAMMLANLASSRRGRDRERGAMAAVFLPTSLLALGVGIMVLGLLYSRSRMGILACLVSLLFVGGLAAKSAQSWRGIVLTLTLLVVAGTYGAWIGYQPVKDRFGEFAEEKGGDLGSRVRQWQDTLQMVRAYPLLGSGLGSYTVLYPRYQTTTPNLRMDHAHNDYLQIVAETGLAGACLLFLPIFYACGATVRTALRTASARRRYLAAGLSGGILAMLLHSAVDFNLQIPANALLFSILLGIACKVRALDREQSDSVHSRVFALEGAALALQDVSEKSGIPTC